MPDITGDVRPTQIEKALDRSGKIRALNDKFRGNGAGGIVAVTPGIRALGMSKIEALANAVRNYDSFDEGNDPYGERDMGTITYDGDRIFWKIDYDDTELEYGSPDPTDPSMTTRVLTIMLASEY